MLASAPGEGIAVDVGIAFDSRGDAVCSVYDRNAVPGTADKTKLPRIVSDLFSSIPSLRADSLSRLWARKSRILDCRRLFL